MFGISRALVVFVLWGAVLWAADSVWVADYRQHGRFELSYGNSQLFIAESDRQDLRSVEKSVLPVSAALFWGEWFFWQKWHGVVVFNLPTSSQKFLVGDEVREERVSPYLGLGPLWTPWRWQASSRAVWGPQFSLLSGVVFRTHGVVLPAALLGGRIHVASRDGFTLYLGGSATLGVRAFSLVYGVGHRF